MKHLLVLRHGKSDWSDPGKVDFDRPLAKRGQKDSPRMGEVLALFECVPDRILSSPARRAKQTAELAAKACGYSRPIDWHESFYGGGSDDILAALQRLPDRVDLAMVVGHNPILEETVAELLIADSYGPELKLPTAGLVYLDLDILDWAELDAGDAILRWFLIPKLVKAIQ